MFYLKIKNVLFIIFVFLFTIFFLIFLINKLYIFLFIISFLFFFTINIGNVKNYVTTFKSRLSYKESLILSILYLCNMDEEEDILLFEYLFNDIMLLFYNFLLSSLFFIYPNKQVDLFWLILTTFSLNLTVLLYYITVYGIKSLNSKIEWNKISLSNFLFPYIEIFSLVFKIINTGFRLYSNFLAGHLIVILLYFLNSFLFNIMNSFFISLFFFLGLSIYYTINLLEIVLAIIQYYVFLLLNAMFCSDTH